MAGVSQSEWEAIPDVGDYSLKYKQSKRREIFTPMPDHVIEGARNDAAVSGVALLLVSGVVVVVVVHALRCRLYPVVPPLYVRAGQEAVSLPHAKHKHMVC